MGLEDSGFFGSNLVKSGSPSSSTVICPSIFNGDYFLGDEDKGFLAVS